MVKIKNDVDLKEFIYWINNYQPSENDYNFYMITNDGEYEIIPIYNEYNEVHELDIKEDGENILDAFNLTVVTEAGYSIIKREDTQTSAKQILEEIESYIRFKIEGIRIKFNTYEELCSNEGNFGGYVNLKDVLDKLEKLKEGNNDES